MNAIESTEHYKVRIKAETNNTLINTALPSGLKKTGKEGERPAFSRIVSSLSFLLLQPSLTRREIIFCSGKGGALPYLRKEAGYFLPGLTRGQKGNPLYANWIDIICRDASQSSAGAQNAWGFGKEFETAIHPTGSF